MLVKLADDSFTRDWLASFWNNIRKQMHKVWDPVQSSMTLDIRQAKSLTFFTVNQQSVDRRSECTCAQGLPQPDSSAGTLVILAGTEYSSDIGRRCSALPINIEDGIKALTAVTYGITIQHTSEFANEIPQARSFVLENTSNYFECKGIEGSFLHRIGTAMGTSFPITYPIIFMIWLKTPIIH